MMVSKTKLFLLYLAMIISLIMYVPSIYNSGLYDVLRYIEFGVMGLLVMTTFSFSTIRKYRFTSILGVILVFLLIEFLVFFAFLLNKNTDDLIQIVIVFLMLIAGINSSIDEPALIRLCTVYSIGTVFLGAISVITYLGSFSLSIDQYAISGKNQVGAIVAFGAGLSFYLSYCHTKGYMFSFILAIVGIILSIVIRCRTAMVALLLLVIYIVARKWNLKQIVFFAIVLATLYLVFFNTINDFLLEIFIGHGDIEVSNNQDDYLNSLSTNRFERNALGVAFLVGHPLTGELGELSHIPLIHNYVLLRLVRYGVFALPFLLIYCLFLIKFLRMLFKGRLSLGNMGWILLSIPLFCSLLEPSAPFGPGTVQLMPFLLCGLAVRNEKAK